MKDRSPVAAAPKEAAPTDRLPESRKAVALRPPGALRFAAGWGRAVLDLLYPPICPLCYRPLAREDRIICLPCRAAMSRAVDWRCTRCGAGGFGSPPEAGQPCRLCPPVEAAWQGVLSVTAYQDQVARFVHLFKYQRRLELGEVMAQLMTEQLADPLRTLGGRIDTVAPVPLHWFRRLQRGFNQSHLLARALCAGLGLAYQPRLLQRARYTRRQALIPRDRRAANVAGAFRLRRAAGPVRDHGILLVDDVVTSGHTIQECARVLMEAGAREVWIASFARAGMGRPGDEE